MHATGKSSLQAWTWAIGLNLIVFFLIWFALFRLPASGTSALGRPDDSPSEPGSTFGEMTHLVGDTGSGNQSVASGESVIDGTAGEASDNWVGEFYLDRGPALSIATRVNTDGSARAHPTDQDWAKSPTYEDTDTSLTADDINYPVMSPQYFSKLDLPDEFRDMNLDLTVSIHLDTRGRVIGVPEIIRSSGHRVVDEITIDKIMNEAAFTPATRKDTGQPVSVRIPFPVWWRQPGSN